MRTYWSKSQPHSSERGPFTVGGAVLSGDWRKVEDIYDPKDLSYLYDGHRETLERVMNKVTLNVVQTVVVGEDATGEAVLVETNGAVGKGGEPVHTDIVTKVLEGAAETTIAGSVREGGMTETGGF
jgi:hypothetical protein